MSQDESRYPAETLDGEDDDGTMPANVAELEKAVIGRRIVSAQPETTTTRWGGQREVFTLTLDDGTKVGPRQYQRLLRLHRPSGLLRAPRDG
jgi:hypothetical protein